MILQGHISGEGNLQGGLNAEQVMSGEMSGLVPPVEYAGDYVVTPSSVTQTLPTESRFLTDDITVNPIGLKLVAIRPDAELIKTYAYDKYINADEEIEIPAYTTTATTLKASSNLSPTITVDMDDYSYYVVERFLSIPEYSVSTKAKGRAEYNFCSYMYEFAHIPAKKIHTLVDPDVSVTSVQNIVCTNTGFRLLYWSTASAISLYSSNGYGVYQTPTAPSVSGDTLTIKAPALAVRGSTTYFTSTFFNALTDIRYQYVIDVYEAPKVNLGIDGWHNTQALNHIIDCINSTTHTLT